MAYSGYYLKPAVVTMGDGSQQVFYGQLMMYNPIANEHTAITCCGDSIGNYGFVCLASSADGGALFGVDGDHRESSSDGRGRLFRIDVTGATSATHFEGF